MLRALLVLTLVGCAPSSEALETEPVASSPRAEECESGAGALQDDYMPSPGWVQGRVEWGRCAASGRPLDLWIEIVRAGQVLPLGSARLSSSDQAAHRVTGWLAYLHSGDTLRLRVRGEGGVELGAPRWVRHRQRPAALPEGTMHVVGGELLFDDERLELGAPGHVRLRLQPGVHTLSGRWGTPVQMRSAPLLRILPSEGAAVGSWRAAQPGLTPFTVTFARATESTVDLWTNAPSVDPLWLDGLQHDARAALALDAPEEERTTPDVPLAQIATRVTADGPSGPTFCRGRPAYLAPPHSVLQLTVDAPRRLRATIGPCTDAPGWGIWTVASGEEVLSSQRLDWGERDQRFELVDVLLPRGAPAYLEAEGDGGGAWIEARAPYALEDATASTSGRAEAELNDDFTAERAFDGDPETEWQGRDGHRDWLALRWEQRVRVAGVWIRNGRNPGYGDRATRGLRIHLLRGDEVIAETEVTLEMGEARSVAVTGGYIDGVSLQPLSAHGLGPAIAEVEIF